MEEGHDMENSTKNSSCATWCWLIAAAVGVLVVLLLWTTRDWGFIQGAFLGLLIFIIGGALLSWLLCKPQAQVTSAATSAVSNAGASTSTVAGGAIAAGGVAAAVLSASSAKADVKPSSNLAGSKELAERKGDWKNENPEAKGTRLAAKKATGKTVKPKAATATKAKKATTAAKAKATADAKAPVKKAAAKTTKTAAKAKAFGADATASIAPTAKAAGKTAVKKADAAVKGTTAKAASAKTAVTKAAPAKAKVAKATVAKTTVSKAAVSKPKASAAKTTKTLVPKATATKKSAPARAPVAADGKPSTMSKARAGGADDLKLLKGVGPGLEKTLNELGFYHFDQVAAWRKKEIDWVDGNLRFKGRIERDEWIKQAKILAKGGTTAFATKAKKG
jgi:predicted flap endonuclease-1-like 5' DNA nuclease